MCGGDGEKAYIYCTDENGDKHLFVYNFVYGVWSERNIPTEASTDEEDNKIVYMDRIGGVFMLVTKRGEIYRIDGGAKRERSKSWEFDTEDMTESSLALKRVQRIKLLYEIGKDSEVSIYAKMSEKRNAARCYYFKNDSTATQRRRGEIVLTNGVDYNLKLSFKGSGYFKLLSVEFELKTGGGTVNDG